MKRRMPTRAAFRAALVVLLACDDGLERYDAVRGRLEGVLRFYRDQSHAYKTLGWGVLHHRDWGWLLSNAAPLTGPGREERACRTIIRALRAGGYT